MLVAGYEIEGGRDWFWEPGRSRPSYFRGSKPGAVMWTLVALVAAALLIPTIVVLGLFRLAELKRARDLPRPRKGWAASQDLQTPK